MQAQVDWRHYVFAGAIVAALIVGGWWIVSRSGEQPRAVAPAGPLARMKDAPEHPPAGAPANLPLAR